MCKQLLPFFAGILCLILLLSLPYWLEPAKEPAIHEIETTYRVLGGMKLVPLTYCVTCDNRQCLIIEDES